MEATGLRAVARTSLVAGAFSLGTRESQNRAILDSLQIVNHSLLDSLQMNKQAASAATAPSALPERRQRVCPACKSFTGAGFKLMMIRPIISAPREQHERASMTAAASQGEESEDRSVGLSRDESVSIASVREDSEDGAVVPQLEPSPFNGVDRRTSSPNIISSIDELISLQKGAAGGAVAEPRSPNQASALEESIPAESRGNADTSVSSQPSRSASKTWVRDSTGTMRRAVQPARPSPSQGAPGKPLSPSRMKLPRHGAPRAAAVMRILYEARDLTTDGVLDQLAEAVQRSELNMVSRKTLPRTPRRAPLAMQHLYWLH